MMCIYLQNTYNMASLDVTESQTPDARRHMRTYPLSKESLQRMAQCN